MTDLSALIAKLDAAREATPELRDAVLSALGWTFIKGRYQYPGEDCWRDPDGNEHDDPPEVLTSLDDCLRYAVPEGWAWMCGCYPGELMFADLAVTEESGLPPNEARATAPTVALALCIAALLAREKSDAE